MEKPHEGLRFSKKKFDKRTIEMTLHSNRVAMLSCIRNGNAAGAARFAKTAWHFAILLDDCMRDLASRGLVRVGWPGLEEYLPKKGAVNGNT
jgi:hypothetical protein